ncbi:MAG: lipid-binding SYLF domain-containing protein [Planctomycetota bacterium]
MTRLNRFGVCFLFLAVLSMVGMSLGCSTAPKTAEGRAALVSQARAALGSFESKNPAVYGAYRDTSAGVAVFPQIGKAGFWVGGAYGQGVLLVDDQVAGYCEVTQGSIGLQLGAQSFTEVIFFETDSAVERFKSSQLEFSANASAVALNADVGAAADFDNGVAVFILDAAGLMYEASIGGQAFDYIGRGAFDEAP